MTVMKANAPHVPVIAALLFNKSAPYGVHTHTCQKIDVMRMSANGKFLYKYRVISLCRWAHYIGNIDSNAGIRHSVTPWGHISKCVSSVSLFHDLVLCSFQNCSRNGIEEENVESK